MIVGQRVKVVGMNVELLEGDYEGRLGTVLSGKVVRPGVSVLKVELDEGRVHAFFADYELEVIA